MDYGSGAGGGAAGGGAELALGVALEAVLVFEVRLAAGRAALGSGGLTSAPGCIRVCRKVSRCLGRK